MYGAIIGDMVGSPYEFGYDLTRTLDEIRPGYRSRLWANALCVLKMICRKSFKDLISS